MSYLRNQEMKGNIKENENGLAKETEIRYLL